MKFTVEGMTCGHCIRAVTRAIHALDPEARVDIDLSAGIVTVIGDVAAEQAAAAIAAEGYPVSAIDPA